MKRKFVKTKNVRAFVALAEKLKNAPSNVPKIGLVYGAPGLGKTNTILWWSLKQDAVLVTAANGMSRIWFLKTLVTELGEEPKKRAYELFEQAVTKLIEHPQILIVDEVDYLVDSTRAIETVRDLHDRTGIPVLLVGMGAADKKLKRYKHLYDRLLGIYKFVPFDLEDVKKIVTTLCDVPVDDDVIEIIAKNANRLRQIVIYILKIEELAQTNGYKRITKQDLEL